MSWTVGEKITAAKLNALETAATVSVPLTYTIYKDTATTNYAKAHFTGGLNYGGSGNANGVDGTNPSLVTQAVLDAMIMAEAGAYRHMGRVLFKKGTYEFPTEVAPTLPGAVTATLGLIIEGEGKYATTLEAIGAHPLFNFVGTSAINRFEGITMRNMQITSDAAVYVANKHLLIFNWATFVEIYDSIIINAYDSGVYLNGNMDTDMIYGNAFYGNKGNGILINTENDVRIWGNNVYGNLIDGIRALQTHYLGIENNWISSNGRYGIYSELGQASTITGNSISVNGREGIILTSGSDNTVSANVVFENGNETHNTYDGISLGAELNDVIVGNRVFDEVGAPNQRYGINEEGASDYNMIIANNCRNGGATGGILTLGANSKINLCWNNAVWVP